MRHPHAGLALPHLGTCLSSLLRQWVVLQLGANMASNPTLLSIKFYAQRCMVRLIWMIQNVLAASEIKTWVRDFTAYKPEDDNLGCNDGVQSTHLFRLNIGITDLGKTQGTFD